MFILSGRNPKLLEPGLVSAAIRADRVGRTAVGKDAGRIIARVRLQQVGRRADQAGADDADRHASDPAQPRVLGGPDLIFEMQQRIDQAGQGHGSWPFAVQFARAGQGEVPPGGVAAEQEARGARRLELPLEDPASGRHGDLDLGGPDVLRRQPVLDRQDGHARPVRQPSAQGVVGAAVAEGEAAAVPVDHQRRTGRRLVRRIEPRVQLTGGSWDAEIADRAHLQRGLVPANGDRLKRLAPRDHAQAVQPVDHRRSAWISAHGPPSKAGAG